MKSPFTWFPAFLILLLGSCSASRRLDRTAKEIVLNNEALKRAHVGISIYDPASERYLYNYQGDKYFVPASNTKIPTCYAAMKYLGDSLVGGLLYESDTAIFLVGTGDPTLLHPDFSNQPLVRFLAQKGKPVTLIQSRFEATAPGSGWSWDDYQSTYTAERSFLPLYGNTVRFYLENGKVKSMPIYFSRLLGSTQDISGGFSVTRSRDNNDFRIESGKNRGAELTFSTLPYNRERGLEQAALLLADTLKLAVRTAPLAAAPQGRPFFSQPTDSLLKLLMHRSDNFFAEQALLMVSARRLGLMSDSKIIDTILKTDLQDLPQKPRWVDGSGLSRYNLFTPQSLIAILNKMETEFGRERLRAIFATGNKGTLTNYYVADSGYLYAKTGTLSGVVALSGYMETKRGRHLIFSVLVNNHGAAAAQVRRAVEAFLQDVRKRY